MDFILIQNTGKNVTYIINFNISVIQRSLESALGVNIDVVSDGDVCFCDHDNCNKAETIQWSSKHFLLIFLYLTLTKMLLN